MRVPRSERSGSAAKRPREDAVGEGNVTELARDLDDESVRALERKSQRTRARVEPDLKPPRARKRK